MHQYQIVDLAQEIFTDAPHWPAHPATSIEAIAWHPSGAPRAMFLHMCDHSQTHTDALNHVDDRSTAPGVDKIPLGSFLTRGIALDVTGMVQARQEISLELLREVLDRTNLVPPRGGTVLVTTGHYRRTFPGEDYLTKYAGLSEEAADYLYRDCGVVNIGVDAPSIDAAVNADEDRFPCHDLCRDLHRLNSENLANIEDVAGKEFLYIGLPLKVRNGTASPVRAVAVLNL